MLKMESSSTARQPKTSIDQWLTRRGLRGNPFKKWNAEHDQDLPSYFVDLGEFDELLDADEPCVVLARRGCGKTAQRRMLAAHYRPLRQDSQWLAVAYTYNGFERAIDGACGDIRELRPIHHVRAFLHLGMTALMDEASRDSRMHTALTRPNVASRLAAYVACFTPCLADASLSRTPSQLDELNSLELLEGFADLVKNAGLDACAVLVDGVDEFPLTANDPVEAVAFLAPLLGPLPLIEMPGLAFRFFLPQELEPILRTRRWFRADRLQIFRIGWDKDSLLALIRQRLVYYSQRKPPYEGLGQLCDDRLSQVIAEELPPLAQGLPRAALVLADMLLKRHCQQPNPSALIPLKVWEEVKESWLACRDDFVMMGEDVADLMPGVTGSIRSSISAAPHYDVLEIELEKHLVWLGKRDITRRINPKDYQVLVSLYQYQDRVCTKNFLAEKAWPECAGGVSDQTIAACIARLRRALGQSSPDAGYIETIRGHGYRLHARGFQEPKESV